MSSSATLPVRVVAGLTAAYSAALVVRPGILARPTGLTTDDGSVPAGTAALVRSIGVRDAALSLALAFAGPGKAMDRLSAARVVCDAGDALWFASAVPSSQRVKICGGALGWAAVETAVALRARRAG